MIPTILTAFCLHYHLRNFRRNVINTFSILKQMKFSLCYTFIDKEAFLERKGKSGKQALSIKRDLFCLLEEVRHLFEQRNKRWYITSACKLCLENPSITFTSVKN